MIAEDLKIVGTTCESLIVLFIRSLRHLRASKILQGTAKGNAWKYVSLSDCKPA